jgi:hypothetical protein
LLYNFPQSFSYNENNDLTYSELNSLASDSFIVTVRRTDSEQNTKFSDYIKEFTTLDISEINQYDNKSTITLNYTDGTYDDIYFKRTESYHGIGGLVYVHNITNDKIITEESFKGLIDPLFSFVMVEFVLENLEYDILIYVEIIFQQNYGTFYENYFNSNVIDKSVIKKGYIMEYIQAIVEIIFVIVVIYLTVMYIKDFIHKNMLYDKWYKEEILRITNRSLQVRQMLKPELFRKLNYLMSGGLFYELINILLSIYLIYLKVDRLLWHIEFEDEYNSLNKKSIIDLRNKLYEILNYDEVYTLVGAILIFTCSIRLMDMLNFGKYFQLLLKTITESINLNINFVAIILLIQPAFISFSYFIFGVKTYEYHSLGNATMSSFNILFGNVNYETLYNVEPVLGPIFFFIYLFVINMILLNLFLALIYSAYIKVKEKIRRTTEIYSLRRVYLFCCYRKKKIGKDKNTKESIEADLDYDKLRVIYYLQRIQTFRLIL